MPFKNGGNDAFTVNLTGMSKNLDKKFGQKIGILGKNHPLKIGKFRP